MFFIKQIFNSLNYIQLQFVLKIINERKFIINFIINFTF